MTQRDELGRWPKGVSGNPSGPPAKHIKLTPAIQRIAGELAAKYPMHRSRAEAMGLDLETATVGDVVIHGWLAEAAQGKAPQVAELLNRLDGKVADRVEVDGGPRVLSMILEEATRPADREPNE